MTARSEDIPFMSTLGLLLTYRCTILCPHCLVEAGPERKEKMALGSAFGWIDEAAGYRNGTIRCIELTGGEPFYDLQTLALISDHAMHAGLSVSAITNAGWAETLEQAILTLNELPAIRKISISTDVYHQQFIPVGYVHNAIIAAELLGRKYDIAVTTDNEHDERYRSIIARLEKFVEPGRIRSTATVPAGRAMKQASALNRRHSPEPFTAACTASSVPVILPDGRVMACAGPMLTRHDSCPLCLGNLRKESLANVLDRAEINPLLHLLRVWGPHRMVSLLRSRGHGALLPKEYLCGSGCDICTKLLSDRRLANLLTSLLDEQENRNVIAYARMQRLKEPEMVQRCHLDGSDMIDAANALLVPDA